MVARIRIVILNFNGGALVERAVAAVEATNWPVDAREVVLVDNASTDGSPEAVTAAHPSVRLVRSARNVGFPANNLALTDLDGFDYVALINPDTEVDREWLAPLVAALDADVRLGAACPLLLFADGGAVNNAGCEVLVNGYARDRAMGVVDVGSLEPCEVFAWSGGAVLLRPAYLDDVGLLDERYFLYYEDIDLSWRGQLRGWRFAFVPASTVRHWHAASVGVGSSVHRYFTERNRLVTLVRNAPPAMAVGAVLRFPVSTLSYFWTEGVLPLTRRSRPTLSSVRLRFRAYIGFLRMLPYALRSRRRIRRSRMVTDVAITGWFREP